MEKNKDSLGRNHTPRSTNAVREYRVSAVYQMLVDGKSRTDIARYCADEWNIASRQADSYIKQAREKIEQDCSISRQELLAETIAGLRQIRNKAESKGQYQVAVNSIKLITELVGIGT